MGPEVRGHKKFRARLYKSKLVCLSEVWKVVASGPIPRASFLDWGVAKRYGNGF